MKERNLCRDGGGGVGNRGVCVWTGVDAWHLRRIRVDVTPKCVGICAGLQLEGCVATLYLAIIGILISRTQLLRR